MDIKEIKPMLKNLIDKSEITLLGINHQYTTSPGDFVRMLTVKDSKGKETPLQVFTLHVKIKRG